jgi:hypothetical protein
MEGERMGGERKGEIDTYSRVLHTSRSTTDDEDARS